MIKKYSKKSTKRDLNILEQIAIEEDEFNIIKKDTQRLFKEKYSYSSNKIGYRIA